MGKRRGSVDSKPAGKKPRKQPAKRTEGGRSRAAEQEDGKGDVSDDGKLPNKKSKATTPGAKTTKKTVQNVDKASGECRARKKALKAAPPAVKQPKAEETEREIEDLLSLETEALDPGASLKEDGDMPVIKFSDSEDADSDEEEWEDVEELNAPVLEALQATTSAETSVPTKSVEIEIETAEAARKRLRREKRKAEFAAYVRRTINRFSKELREDTHKVHLLCLLANGFHRSKACSLPDLQAVALSVVPVKFINVPAARVDVVYLTNLVKWFITTFSLNPEMSLDDREPLSSTLERRFGVYGVRDGEEMVHLFLILLRALQLLSRLVLSLQPIPLKDPPTKAKRNPKEKPPRKNTNKSKTSQKSPKGKAKKSPKQKQEKGVKKEEPESQESGEDESRKLGDEAVSCKDVGKTIKNKKCVKVEREEETSLQARVKNQLRRKSASKITYKEDSESYTDNSDSDYSCSDSQDSDFSEWEESFERKVKIAVSVLKQNSKKSCDGAGKRPLAPGQPKAKSSPNNDQPKKSVKIISTDEEDEEILSPPSGNDQWVEVYLEREEKWVCVDCVQGKVNQPSLSFKAATKPVTYLVGIDNSGYAKDVTRRYDPEWMTRTRKRRVDPEWWEETLQLYQNPDMKQEDREDAEFETKLLDQPLPTSITEYKNHPLYVLKRHLLKYEAIYPESAAILGYCRGEAVYSRSCVHTLHSRDTWLKEARVVRLGEVPYKMVKGQSNRARKARLEDPEKRDMNDLALFGQWQTEDYQPPVAVDGKVPRNEFGNVYLFQPSMLPIGCAHLRVPNLHRVARKLDIDCVNAITGFDFHCGFSHPVNDGYIVCEEHKDILLAAWDNEQAEIERKQKEKREKRALGNWKLLIKGLLIRERLKARYGNKDTEHLDSSMKDGGFSSEEDEKPETVTPAQDAAVSWPQNRQTEEQQEGKKKRKSKREKRGDEKHLFPFEKV